MLTFEDLRTRLIENLRSRVRNGEVTERRLARVTGISQPHIHNLLKGIRTLTPDLGDQILKSLQMSLTDFLDTDPGGLREVLPNLSDSCRYVSVLDGLIGPSHPWPSRISTAERFRLTDPAGIRLTNPVAARAAEDVRMGPLFSPNDISVLDQSIAARTDIDPDALYLVKEGSCGLIRRARITAAALYVFTEDCRSRPTAWQRIPVSAVPVAQTLRARVIFPADEDQWDVRVA